MTEQQIFFVCGAPKSGTTWLQRVLDAHPEIQCSGEGHFIENFSVPLASLMRDYVTKMKVVSTMVYEGQPHYPPLQQEDLDRVARLFIMDRLMSLKPGPQIRWIGDKTPRYTCYLPQLARLFPKARFINIVRDPRDVAMARLFYGQRLGVSSEVVENLAARARFIGEGGLEWVKCVAPVVKFAAKNPGKLYSLKYEDMIGDPSGEARKMFDFLGVRRDAATIDQIVAATSFEAQSGRKRGVEKATAFLRKGVVGDWVGRLDEAALSNLYEACGELLIQQGYTRHIS